MSDRGVRRRRRIEGGGVGFLIFVVVFGEGLYKLFHSVEFVAFVCFVSEYISFKSIVSQIAFCFGNESRGFYTLDFFADWSIDFTLTQNLIRKVFLHS